MLDTLLSLQREIESKMCLTGRQHKLWFLSKKRKMSQTGSVSSLWQKTSDVSLFLFQQQRRLDLLTITNPGEYAYFGLCACVFVIHCTAQHSTPRNNEYLHGASRTGLFVHMGWLWGLCDFSYSHNKHQLHPKSKNLQKEAFSHDLSAFPQSCRSTPGVPIPEQWVQPALLCLYGKLNVLSMHLGESWNCIQSSGRDRWGSQEGCSPHMSKISGCSNTLWLNNVYVRHME